jgi:hypothetical protein
MIGEAGELTQPRIGLVSVPRDLVQVRGEWDKWVSEWLLPLFQSEELDARTNRVLIPYHHAQLPMIQKLFPDVEVLDATTQCEAHMSFRTVQPAASSCVPPHHLKLPINFTTTSATRTITPFSVHNAPAITFIAHRIISPDSPLFVCDEVASVGVALNPERQIGVMEARNLGAIIRMNPELALPQETIIPCASLVEISPDGSPHVIRIFNLDTLEKRVTFLDK